VFQSMQQYIKNSQAPPIHSELRLSFIHCILFNT